MNFLRGEDADDALSEAKVLFVDRLASADGTPSGGGAKVVNEPEITINADVVILADEGVGDLVSGVEEME